MEFPELGANCALTTCKQLGEFDFKWFWSADFNVCKTVFSEFPFMMTMRKYRKFPWARKRHNLSKLAKTLNLELKGSLSITSLF